MAYKFQSGAARLSGSTTFEQALVGESTISASAALQGASLAADGAAVLGGSLTAVGIAAGGALSGVTTLAASGLASVASISMDDGSTLGPDSVAGLWTFSAAGDTTQADGAYDFDLASHDGTNGLKLAGVLVDASAADLNFTNVAAAGTAEASKAVVLDASKNIATIGTVGCGAITSTGASSLGATTLVSLNNSSGGITNAGAISGVTSMATNDVTYGDSGITMDADGGHFTIEQDDADKSVRVVLGADVATSGFQVRNASNSNLWGVTGDGAVSGSGAIQAGGALTVAGNANLNGTLDVVAGACNFAAVTASGALIIESTLTAASLGSATVDLTADLMIIDDGAAGSIKTTSLANYSTAIAGAGLLSTAGVIAIVNSANGGINIAADAINLDFNDLSAAAVNVAADSFAFLDADGNVTQKESIADLATAMAGTGITATSGVFSVSAASTPTAFGDVAATMVEGLNYASAALTAARVLTLPNSDDLDVGEFVKIKMAAGLSSTIYASIAIAVGSGDLIDGDASIRLESPYAAVNLYKVAENVWRIL